MSDITRPDPASQPRRAVVQPGAPGSAQGRKRERQRQQRRTGLLILGLILTAGAGFGAFFFYESIDQRSLYLMAARDIDRWERVTAADFVTVQANVGPASAVRPGQVDSLLGKWATGRIPAGTIVTGGLFESPPLSGESDADRVLIQVSLPAGEAPFGTLETGDTVALLGESTGPDGEPEPLALIGVLSLEFVDGDSIFYIVSPEEAFTIKETVDEFMRAPNRTILKMGIDTTAEDLTDVLSQRAATIPAVPYEFSPESGAAPESAGAQP